MARARLTGRDHDLAPKPASRAPDSLRPIGDRHCAEDAGHVSSAPSSRGQWRRTEALHERLSALDQVWRVEVSRLAPWRHAGRTDLPVPGPLTEAWQRLFEALWRFPISFTLMLQRERQLRRLVAELTLR